MMIRNRIEARTSFDQELLYEASCHSPSIAAELDNPTVMGEERVYATSMMITLRHYDNGTKGVNGSIHEAVIKRRASGKIYRYRRIAYSFSLRTTLTGLLFSTESNNDGNGYLSRYIFDTGVANQDTDQFLYIRPIIARLFDKYHYYPRRRIINENDCAFTGRDTGDDFGRGVDLRIEEMRDRLMNHIGPVPVCKERFPLLNSYRLSGPTLTYFVDAHDWREVATRAFSAYNVRKPLVRALEKTEGEGLEWFREFRGLVPIEAIVESMNNFDPHAFNLHINPKILRRVLRQLPEPILRRILKEPTHQAIYVMRDICAHIESRSTTHRDITALPGLIEARGQRHIRSSRDLEQLVHTLPEDPQPKGSRRSKATMETLQREASLRHDLDFYNDEARRNPALRELSWEEWKQPEIRENHKELVEQLRRRRMAERERRQAEAHAEAKERRRHEEAQRAQWADELTAVLQNREIGDHRIIVATSAQQLSEWGAAMNNCIGVYHRHLGLDILGAVVDAERKVVLNFQVTHDEGLTQFLGVNNRDARSVTPSAQRILDELIAAGVTVGADVLGARGLKIETAQLPQTV